MGFNPINKKVLCTRVMIISFLDWTFCLYDETLITYVLMGAKTLSISNKMPHTKYVNVLARVLQTYTRNLGSLHLGHAASVQALCQFKIATAKEHLFEVTEHK